MDYYDDDMIEQDTHDDDLKNNIIERIVSYRDSITKYKDEHKNELDTYWRPQYDEILEQLDSILAECDYNWLSAREKFDKMECCKYDNFSQYVYNHDVRNTKHIKGTDVRAKTIRRKRSNLCPKCKRECRPTKEMDTLKCPICGYEIMKNKAGIPDNIINGEKHIRKHYDKLIGSARLPSTITKLLPYLSTWLTQWKYIRDWLMFSNRFDAFVSHYQQRSGLSLHYEDFDTVLEQIPNNRMTFDIYELFTEEFYKMTELMAKTNKKTTNVNGSDELIMNIIGCWLQQQNTNKIYSFMDIADENAKVGYDGTDYNIGVYLNKLALIYDYDQHHIKYKIVHKWCVNGVDCIVFPGLMFNFGDVFTISQNIPKSFVYSENYNKIMSEVFHSPFATITPADINILINLHLRFNEFYKQNVQKTGKKKDTKTNSPLFVVVFKCIVTTFKHFHKYIYVLDHIPHRITESITKNEIDNLWLQFVSLPENRDLYDMYDNDLATNNTEHNDDKQDVVYYDDLDNLI